jgi:hypothetical protein
MGRKRRAFNAGEGGEGFPKKVLTKLKVLPAASVQRTSSGSSLPPRSSPSSQTQLPAPRFTPIHLWELSLKSDRETGNQAGDDAGRSDMQPATPHAPISRKHPFAKRPPCVKKISPNFGGSDTGLSIRQVGAQRWEADLPYRNQGADWRRR